MENKIFSVCVIGGGSAGTMALLRTILNNDECLFFPGTSKDKKRSRAFWVRKIENMPAHLQYKRGIQDPNIETLNWIQNSEFRDNFHHFKNTGVKYLKKRDDGVFEITDSNDRIHYSYFVILCTGVMDVQPHIAESIEKVFDYANAQTIDYCLICDGHHVLNKRCAVIGHSNSAAWVAIMLHERYRPSVSTILTNGEIPEFQVETKKLLDFYNIKVITSPITDILGEERGKVLNGFLLSDGKKVEAEICFVALGMIVYNDLAKQLGAELDERGFVRAQDSGETSVSGLFVAGDLKANTKKQIYVAWDTAVNAANSVNQKLRVARRERDLKSI